MNEEVIKNTVASISWTPQPFQEISDANWEFLIAIVSGYEKFKGAKSLLRSYRMEFLKLESKVYKTLCLNFCFLSTVTPQFLDSLLTLIKRMFAFTIGRRTGRLLCLSPFWKLFIWLLRPPITHIPRRVLTFITGPRRQPLT